MNEPSTAAGVTIGCADDTHGFWRPGNPNTSTWAVSPSAALTRTSVWYTANTLRAPGYVYVAPSGCLDSCTVLILEISGLGPWDTITGIYSNFAAAATSLNLALAAPSSQALLIAAVTGDSTTAGQAFAPATWTTLPTVTASNGSDHTCDCVLTSAYLLTTGSVSVNGTASSAADLSGVIIGFQVNAASPVPGGVNANWPGRFICEAALGSGYETPPDQCTWTVLTDNAWPSPWQGSSSQFKRAWGWQDKSAIPWGLGQYQTSSGVITLDNADGWLSPSNTGSGFYSNALNANMSFQSGVSPWTAQNGATLAQSGTHVYASAAQGLPQYSLQVTPNGSTAAPGAASERVAVTGSTAYTASAWFYSVAGYATGAQAAISWYTSGGSLISTSTSAALAIPAATWTQVTETATSPSNAATAAVIVQFSGTPSAVAFWVAEAALALGSAVVQTGRVTAGTPVRLRFALGTTGGTTYNRWYIWQRNAQSWPEQRNRVLRGFVPATLCDPWQSASGTCATPYRGEVEQDNPGWWWPCDDQPLAGGVLPVSLRNAAAGSSTALSIVASPTGVSSQDTYSTGLGGLGAGGGGTDLTSGTSTVTPSVATYAVAANSGWMYGDPQVSPQSSQTGNPVTAQPGSAGWQQAGLLGNTGSAGWTLIANDAFPSTAAGITVTGWFNPAFFGTATGALISSSGYNQAGQPYAPLSLLELATSSGPLAILQLDMSGNLQLQINGGASIAIYTTSDLRCNTWFRVTLQLTTTGYTVWVNGGLTASVTGSASVGTVTPTWLIANGDLGSHGGSSAGTGLVHGWNGMVSHLKVYSGLLPKYREIAQYAAAVTGFGVLPAPTGVQLGAVANLRATGFTPDGSAFKGSYPPSGTGPFTMSALAVAVAGSYTSGPAQRAVIAARGQISGSTTFDNAVSVSWTTLAPLVQVYTSSAAGTEAEASAALSSCETYTAGYGGSATAAGQGSVSAGTGASPPSGPSSLGDTVAARIERALGYGGITVPMRAVDYTANAAVQAALDVGGQQAGANVAAMVASDSGWWFYDNTCTGVYKSRAHLAADTAAWAIGMNTAAGQMPFAKDVTFDNDPQRVFTAITVNPYSPDGASLAELVPAGPAAVNAAQQQYGARPLTVSSYLQSGTSQQNQANWLFAYYGTLRKRVAKLTVDAASHPAAWGLVAALNLSDVITVYDQPFGAPATTVTCRVSSVEHSLSFGANGSQVAASVTIVADPYVASYWV